MSRHLLAMMTITAFATAAVAQYGTAPSNYYPDKYNGSTFTGVVAETADDKITLTYSKGNKTDTFTGRFEADCSVPSTKGGGMAPSAIPKGTVMTAFFNPETKKVNGQKIKENMILAISFDTWQGREIAKEKKKIFFCTNDVYRQFRVW